MDKTKLAYADVGITQKAAVKEMTKDVESKMGRIGSAIYNRFLAFLYPKNEDGSSKDLSLKDFKTSFASLLPELQSSEITPDEAKAVLAMMKYELLNSAEIHAEGEAEDKEKVREGVKPWLPEVIRAVDDAVAALKEVPSKRE